MNITIITLFPELFETFFSTSILGRAQKKKKVVFKTVNLRDFGKGIHKQVDDRPYGGGVGMVLRPDILAEALKRVSRRGSGETRVVLMSASGKTFTQAKAKELSRLTNLIIVCGHYEGIDQRFIDRYVDEEISIGDYVLTGGEIPAMVVTDAIVRLIPGVLEKPEALENESFSFKDLHLEYPQYTRPKLFEGEEIPSVLTSGNHQEIENWRKEKSSEKTRKVRPDLLK